MASRKHRERVHIVGLLRKLHCAKLLQIAGPCNARGSSEVLGWRIDGNKRSTLYKARRKYNAFLARGSPKVSKRSRLTLKRLRQKGIDPYDQCCPVVVDIAGSKPHSVKHMSPCLTRAEASPIHYVPARGRRLTMKERLRL